MSRIWKLQVYNAVVISQLIYAFDSLHLTDTCKRKLDAFHMRGLRYVFDIPPAFISKISNKKVLEMANKTLIKESLEALKPDVFTQNMKDRSLFKPEDFKQIIPITELIQKKQQSLLGHLLRASEENPERKVTCTEKALPRRANYRRIGGPRQHWLEENMKASLLQNEEMEYESDNEDHATIITSYAEQRLI